MQYCDATCTVLTYTCPLVLVNKRLQDSKAIIAATAVAMVSMQYTTLSTKRMQS